MKLKEIENVRVPADVVTWLNQYRLHGASGLSFKDENVASFIALYLNAPKIGDAFVPPPVQFNVQMNCRLSFFDLNTITLDWLDAYQTITISGDGDWSNAIGELHKSSRKANPSFIVCNTLVTSTLNVPELMNTASNVSVTAFARLHAGKNSTGKSAEYEDSVLVILKDKARFEIAVTQNNEVNVIHFDDSFALQEWLIDNDYRNFV